MKLKWLHFADVAKIQEALTDELKKIQKEEFSAAFQKLYDRKKACMYTNGAYFELKKAYVFLICLRFLKKKSFLKLLDRTMYVSSSTRVTPCQPVAQFRSSVLDLMCSTTTTFRG